MVLNEYIDKKVFRTAYRQWVAAKYKQAPISFHEAGFFRELQWKRIKHDKMEEKAILYPFLNLALTYYNPFNF